MALTSIFKRKTLSPPTPLRFIVNVVALHLIYVISQQTAEAYVTYIYDDSSYTRFFKFPSISSGIGNSFGNTFYSANLFTAPLSNPLMCKSQNLTRSLSYSQPDSYRHTRRSLSNNTMDDVSSLNLRSTKVSSTQDLKRFLNENSNSKFSRGLKSSNSNSLALLVKRGGCSIEDKARNVMELNEIYSVPGGPKIGFLVIADSNMNYFHNDEYVEDTETPIDLWTSYIDLYYGSDLLYLMQEIYMLDATPHHVDKSIHLTESSFFVEGRNQWQFQVILDGIYLFDDRTLIWLNTLYLFFGIMIIVTMVRFVILLFINRGLRWTRDEAGNINGIGWNRPPHLLRAGEGVFLAVWRDLTSGRMTDEQIKKLPVIEYNVSNMKDICRRYNSAEDGNNNDDTNIEIGSFVGNAYESMTSCSICMEDFEHGEKLLLLPKCGHFYHTKCITPWLMDKGTCALCQTIVSVRESVAQQLNTDEESVAATRNGNESSSQQLTTTSGNSNVTSMETSLAPVSDAVTVDNAANNGDEMSESIVESVNDNAHNNVVTSDVNERIYLCNGNVNVSTQEDATGRDLAGEVSVSSKS